MTSEFKDESLKFKDKTFLEQYLAGKAPLHVDRLNLPSDEELDAAEAEFDEMVAARKQPARHIPLWPWAVAAVAASIMFLLVFNIRKDTTEEKPVVAEVIEPEAIKQSKPQPIVEEKKEEEVLAEVQSMPQPVSKPRPVHKAVEQEDVPASPSPSDSFDYYLAHLEAEMEALDDSVSTAHLEKLISADARLQQLVNRIVGKQTEQVMNELRKDSTANYITF